MKIGKKIVVFILIASMLIMQKEIAFAADPDNNTITQDPITDPITEDITENTDVQPADPETDIAEGGQADLETDIADDSQADSEADIVDESADVEETVEETEAEVTAVDEESAEKESRSAKAEQKVSVEYKAHVQNIGWQPMVSDGATSGVEKQNLRMEAIKIALTNTTEYTGGIKYSSHVQNIGWQSFVSDGALSGTTGKAYRIESMKIQLTGELAEHYDVYYRAYSTKYGWLDWAKNGEIAGSAGLAYPMNGIQIILYEKTSTDKPVQKEKAYLKLLNQGNLMYRAQCQNIGWQNYTWDGKTAGTVGQAKRMEALQIDVSEFVKCKGLDGTVKYQSYCQDIGWQKEVSSGQISGTVGKGKRMEAVRIQLTGKLAEQYDVFYRVHSSNFGWLGWAKNGQTAGTTGYGRSIEAIEIELVEKANSASHATGGRSYHTVTMIPNISYEANVRGIGWQGNRTNGQTAGTNSQSKAVEAIKVALSARGSVTYGGSVEYQTQVSNFGWTSWTKDGAANGRTGENKQVEAIKIKLTGELSNYADIYYRTYVQNYGWLGWAKNGQAAGTAKCGYRMEAMQVKIVPKGSSAPGSTSKCYTESKFIKLLGKFSTQCTNTDAGWYNMSRALMSFNNLVVKPGATVSFFGVAGPCGGAQGYLPAGVVGGMGYGGGICQASTTLYGGVIRAGLQVVERRNHSVPSTYVPIGLDAMVSYGDSDFKFRNPYNTSVTLKTYATSDRRLVIEIYGADPGWFDNVEARSWSTGGGSASAQRIFYKNGKAVKYESLPNSYYY